MSDRDDLTPADLQSDLQDLVAMVYADWDDIDPYAARYLNALDVNDCHDLGDLVGNETAETQIRYLLANAGAWRGDTARMVKAELRRRLARAAQRGVTTAPTWSCSRAGPS